jgi:murein DD-endopeptidase MepM/ murein hydrolase activator NlpD
VLPVAVLVWLWFRRPGGRADWLVGLVLVIGVIAAVSLAVPWLFLPALVRYAYLGTWLVAGVRSWGRVRPADPSKHAHAWSGLGRAAALIVTASAWTIAGLAVDGRRVGHGEVVDLASPLDPGVYLVVSGGSRAPVNAHLATLGADPRFVPWRGQSYGVDLVQIDGFGRRAGRMASPNLGDYRIYGQNVVAPCDGVVVISVNDRSDMAVGARDPDRSQLAGNHVVVRCGDFEVLLAHLQPGSIRVSVGESVVTGDLLGFVGNSGNTDEPHLHVSVQRPAEGLPSFGGEPVWITINGAFLVRNDRVRWE